MVDIYEGEARIAMLRLWDNWERAIIDDGRGFEMTMQPDILEMIEEARIWRERAYEMDHNYSKLFDDTVEYQEAVGARLESLTQERDYWKRQAERTQDRLREEKGAGYVYLMECRGRYKIGYSKRPRERRKSFETKLPFKVKITHLIKTNNARWLEGELHQQFEDKRVRGEWFDLNSEEVAYILSLGDEVNEQ